MTDWSQEQEEFIRRAEANARSESERTPPEVLWGNINEAYEAIKAAKMLLLYASPAKRIQLLDWKPEHADYPSSFQHIEWMRSDLNKIDSLNDDEAKRLRRERDGA